MSERSTFPYRIKRNGMFIPPALVLGLALGLFVSGYWFTDFLPASSKQLLFFTGLASGAGAVAYFFLLQWGSTLLPRLSGRQRAALISISAVAGVVLLLAGTSQWLDPIRYLSFLLPTHRLQLSAAPGNSSASPIAISWINTSLGDISYESLKTTGWKRKGDELVLEDPIHNSLQWSGRTGEKVQLIFRGTTPANKILISWDTHEETITPGSGQFSYIHTFDIPWYASSRLVLSLGLLTFVCLALALSLLVWQNRTSLAESLGTVFAPTVRALDRGDVAMMIGVIILALLMRLPNLGRLFPAVDEYYHLIAARQIVEGAALGSVYQRSLWLVTLPVSLSLRVFGNEFWAARLVGVLFNVLAIVPLYLLARRINRPVAVISSLLFATSPWLVTFARIAREYAYYPFYYLWIIYGMVKFIEAVPQGFVLVRDWNALARPKVFLLGLTLIIPPLFAYYGDLLSTFRAIWIAYLVFGVFLLGRFNFRDRRNMPILLLLVSGLLLVVRRWYEDQKAKVSILPDFNPLPVGYFLPNPQQQWYFDRLAIIVVIGLIGLVIGSLLLRRRNFTPLFILALYAAYLAVFAFFATTFFHTRHLSSTELWYVIVVAMGLYLVWKVVCLLIPWKGRWPGVILAAVLAIAVINPRQIVVPIVSTDPDNPISQDYLHDLTEVHAFMISHVQPNDVLIATVYGLYSSWREAPEFAEKYRITTQTPREEIFSLIEEHESGWIVIDQIRLSLSALGPHEFAGKSDVEYIGLFGDEYVWHWRHSPGSFGKSEISGKGQ